MESYDAREYGWNRVVKLTPEQIGKAGEIKLDQICNEVALACISLVPDLLGVDRLIEFAPAKVSDFDSLDTRPAPLSCYVQVKSKGSEQRYWQLSLSVAERLAKTSKPAFIALFEVGERTEVTSGYLVHLRGAILAKVLARLRDAQRRGIMDLNKRMINLSRKDGVEFKLTGEDLVSALREAIGGRMATYAAEKNRELETLGYGDDRITATVNFGDIDMEALVDAHLGERSLPVEEMVFSERRFNISLPVAPGTLTGGLMTIEASPIEGFELRIEREATGEEVRLECAFVYPALPEIPLKSLKFRVITDLLTLKFGGPKFTYTARLNDNLPRSLQAWRTQLRAILLLHSGNCKIVAKRLADNTEVSLGVSNAPSDVDLREFKEVSRLVDAAAYLLSEANVPDQGILLEELLANPAELKRAHAIMSQAAGVSPLKFTVTEPPPDDAESFGMLFISAYTIGENWFAYCARTTMHRGEHPTEWKGGSLTPVLTERLQEPILTSYDRFKARMERITGLSAGFVYSLVAAPDRDQNQDNEPLLPQEPVAAENE